jgi:hypothetical protein
MRDHGEEQHLHELAICRAIMAVEQSRLAGLGNSWAIDWKWKAMERPCAEVWVV